MSSPSITFQPLQQTPSRPHLQRRSRINRQRSPRSVDPTTQQLSAPVAILQNTATGPYSTTRTTRRTRHRSSLHLSSSVPTIQDRNSSLYSPVSTIHDWSKSCSDLSSSIITESATVTPTGTTGTISTTSCLALNQRLSLYSTSSLYSAAGGLGLHSTEVININNNDHIRWCQSTLELSTITDDCTGIDLGTTVNNNNVYTHSFIDYSTFLDAEDTLHPTTRFQAKTKDGKWIDLKKKLRSVKVSSEVSPGPEPQSLLVYL